MSGGSGTTLLELDISLSPDNYYDDAVRILTTIKPHWSKSTIDIKPLTDGFVNHLLKCVARNDAGADADANAADADAGDNAQEDEEDAVLLRIFGHVDGCNRDIEVHIMNMLSDKGVILPLYCRFLNGIAYAYAPGDVLTQDHLQDVHIQRLIAEKLHSIHQLDVGGAEYFSRMNKLGQMELIQKLWDHVLSEDYADVFSDPRYVEHLPPPDQLTRNLQQMTEVYASFSKSSYPLVFCHLDAHKKNIVYSRRHDHLALLDWEACNMGPEIYDMAVLIDRDVDPHTPSDTSALRKQWVESYLSTHPVHGSQRTPRMLQQWYRDSIQASLVSTLSCVIFALYGIKHIAVQQDFLGFSIRTYLKYKAYQKELDSLDAAANVG